MLVALEMSQPLMSWLNADPGLGVQKWDDDVRKQLKLSKVDLLPENIFSKYFTFEVSKWSSAWLKTEVTSNMCAIDQADAEGVHIIWEKW